MPGCLIFAGLVILKFLLNNFLDFIGHFFASRKFCWISLGSLDGTLRQEVARAKRSTAGGVGWLGLE